MAKKRVRHRKAKKQTRKQRERRILLGASTARKWWNSRKAKKIAKVSRRHRHWVAMKIRRLISEGKKQAQAVAIALNMARKKFKRTKRRA